MNSPLEILIGSGLASQQNPQIQPPQKDVASLADQLAEACLGQDSCRFSEAVFVAKSLNCSVATVDKIITAGIALVPGYHIDFEKLLTALELRRGGKFTESESDQLVDMFLAGVGDRKHIYCRSGFSTAMAIIERGMAYPSTVDKVVQACFKEYAEYSYNGLDRALGIACFGASPEMLDTLLNKYIEVVQERGSLCWLDILQKLSVLDVVAKKFLATHEIERAIEVAKAGVQPETLEDILSQSISSRNNAFALMVAEIRGSNLTETEVDALIQAHLSAPAPSYNKIDCVSEAAKIGCSPVALEQVIGICLEEGDTYCAIEMAKLRKESGLTQNELKKLITVKTAPRVISTVGGSRGLE